MANGEWTRRLYGEPALQDLLADPCLHAVMRRDGVSTEELHRVVRVGRLRLAPERPVALTPAGVVLAGRYRCRDVLGLKCA